MSQAAVPTATPHAGAGLAAMLARRESLLAVACAILNAAGLTHTSVALRDACAELTFLSTSSKDLEGAFKTPGLRNVSLRPPYMHAGQFASLDEESRKSAPPRSTERCQIELGELELV